MGYQSPNSYSKNEYKVPVKNGKINITAIVSGWENIKNYQFYLYIPDDDDSKPWAHISTEFEMLKMLTPPLEEDSFAYELFASANGIEIPTQRIFPHMSIHMIVDSKGRRIVNLENTLLRLGDPKIITFKPEFRKIDLDLPERKVLSLSY